MDFTLSAAELGRRISTGEISPTELATATLDRIEAEDAKLGCFLKLDREGALAAARHAEDMLAERRAGPLTGVPIAIKDNLSTMGLETTCASKILKGYVPPFDATTVARCREAGMVILGKTNLDEFAMGTSTENSAFQKTRNPWDLSRSPGGSSGGSAAAVAGRLAPISLGSDTGGSIRQPASLCGVVGFKPTYGRVSRYGLVAFASSLDQVGPFARTVEDAALVAEAISGPDPRDSTSLDLPPISAASLRDGRLRGLRVALPQELFGEGLAPGVLAALEVAIDRLTGEGVQFESISLPSIAYGVTTYYIIAPAEASSNLARFDGLRFGPQWEGQGHVGVVEKTRGQGFGHEVKTRIMIGTYALSAGYYDAYYLRAQQVRTLMSQEFERAFARFDAILSPTSPVTAFRLGELTHDPMAMKRLDFCTIPANMSGGPALSLNCGYADGLPVGLQLMTGVGEDEKLLQTAWRIEQTLADLQRPAPDF